MARATTGGPAPYAKGSDTLQCPVCGLFNSDDSQRCDQCSTMLQEGPRDYVLRPKDLVRCSHCPASNQPDATFCRHCGARLSHAAFAAAKVAQEAATSSAGRQGMTPQERADKIRAIDAAHAERSALDVPPPTGRGDIADAVAAEEFYSRVDSAWDSLSRDLLEARSAAGLFPSAADTAELRDLERRTAAAWASRERARRHRDRLMFEMDRANSPGMGLPPGDGDYRSDPW